MYLQTFLVSEKDSVVLNNPNGIYHIYYIQKFNFTIFFLNTKNYVKALRT